jgi:hypothetical protein
MAGRRRAHRGDIHTPALGGARRGGRRSAVEGDVLPSAPAQAELQALEPIQPTHPFRIHRPALSSEEHPDPQVAKSWPGVRELANPEA